MPFYIATAMLCMSACGAKNNAPVNEDPAPTVVDLTEMIDRYHCAVDSIAQLGEGDDSVFVNIMEGCDIQQYREPSPDDDYAILEIPQFKHEGLEDWVTAYNGLLCGYNMTSLFELWARADWAGAM